MAAWEEAGTVHARVMPAGKTLQLSKSEAAQVTLARGGDTLYAAWAEQAGRFKRIVVAGLALKARHAEREVVAAGRSSDAD